MTNAFDAFCYGCTFVVLIFCAISFSWAFVCEAFKKRRVR